jgi:hypothetical protein
MDELRDEFDRDGIGPEILGCITEALRPIIRRCPPEALVDRPVTTLTADVEEEIQAAFVEHLVGGRLAEAFAHAGDEHHLLALLRVRARQFVDGKRRKGESERLGRRAKRLLDEHRERFDRAGTGSLQRWSLRGGSLETFGDTDAVLRGIARALPLPPSARRMRRDTQISSRVLDDGDLLTLVEQALGASGCGLTLRDLRVILDERLDLYAVETLSLSQHWLRTHSLEEIMENAPSGLEEVEARVIGGDVVGQLSAQQVQILRWRWGKHRNREQTASGLGISHGTVDNELGRAGRVILAACGGDRNLARSVLDLIAGRDGEA